MRVIIKPMGVVVLLVGMLTLFFLVRFFPVSGGEKAALPAGAVNKPMSRNINLLRPSAWEIYQETPAQGRLSPLTVNPKKLPNGYRFDITAVGAKPWNIGFHHLFEEAFDGGETIEIRFWGRSPQKSQVSVVFQESKAPFTDSFRQEIPLTAEWKEFIFTFKAQAYPKSGAFLGFWLGYTPGSIEIADIRFMKK